MPRRFTRRRNSLALRPVNSNKNVVYLESSIGTSRVDNRLVTTVDSPTLADLDAVQRGCSIKAIYISIDMCGLAGTGVLQTCTAYLMKNPGNNLTSPTPRTEGGSNEKKFIFKTWNYMTMRNQDGNPPYHWEGWIKIPKRYQRFGADDNLIITTASTTAAGHLSLMALYKWYF